MKISMGLDPASIQKAIDKLTEYRDKGLQKKIDRTIGDVSDRIIEVANTAYSTTYRTTHGEQLSPTVTFTVSRTFAAKGHSTWIISAFMQDPEESISFLEFGTGQWTDGAHEYAGKVPYRVSPGSWSSDPVLGKGTWNRWVNVLGRDPNKYPYNREPKRGIWLGVRAGRRYLHNMSARIRE